MALAARLLNTSTPAVRPPLRLARVKVQVLPTTPVDQLRLPTTPVDQLRLPTTPAGRRRLPTTPAGRRRQRMGPRTRHHVLPHLRSTPRLTHRIQQIEIQPQRLALTMLLTPLCMNA